MVSMIPIGELKAASDRTTGVLIRTADTESQYSVDERVAVRVPQEIAKDGTVAAAAAAAVADKIADQHFITGDRRRLIVDAQVTKDLPGAFPAIVPAVVPSGGKAPDHAKFAILDENDRFVREVLPDGVVITDGAGKIPESFLPETTSAPTALWDIADAVNPPPFRLDPDEWKAPKGVKVVTPTYDGSGQTVHPSVMYFPQPLWGYRWWHATTGYENRTPGHEDPMLLVSNDGVNFIPAPGAPFPLDNKGEIPNPEDPTRPLDGFNSDTSLVWDSVDGVMWVTWRWFAPDNSGVIIRGRSTRDGATFTPAVDLTDPVDKLPWYASSQEFVQMDDGTWRMYTVDVQRADPIKYRTAPELTGPWSAPVTVALNTPNAPTVAPWTDNPWHIEVRRFGDWWYAVIATQVHASNYGGDLYLATSRDGDVWDVGATPILPRVSDEYNYLYRGSLVPYSVHGEWKWRLFYGGWPNTPASWTYVTELEQI